MILFACNKSNVIPCKPLPETDHIYFTEKRDSVFLARFTTYPPYPVLYFTGHGFSFDSNETLIVIASDSCILKK